MLHKMRAIRLISTPACDFLFANIENFSVASRMGCPPSMPKLQPSFGWLAA
jgi:hypothetical protein